jgi:hypothetical protein
LLTEHSVANGIEAQVAAPGAMLSRPLSDNRMSPHTCRGRESTYKKQEVKTPSPGTPEIA